MKKQIYNKLKVAIAALLLMGITNSTFSQEAEKQIIKDFNISQGFSLGIDNEYGEINIVNWDNDELSVEITIIVKASSEAKSEKLLDKIDIDIQENRNSVYFNTEISSASMMKEFKIIYNVKAPSYINASLNQSYGNIFVQELTGHAEFELRYGELNVNALSFNEKGNRNTMEIAYGKALIDYASNLDLEIKYSEFNINESESLDIISAYSKFDLGIITDIFLESKYDKVSIEKLYGILDIESAYTNVDVDFISKDFSELHAEMKYGNLKAGLEKNTSFQIEAIAAYGSIRIPDGNYKLIDNNVSQEVNGKVGSEANAKVFAEIRYGNLILN